MAGKKTTIIGKQYGNVTVLEEIVTELLIRCVCGNTYLIKRSNIANYKTYKGCRKCFHLRKRTKNTVCNKVWDGIRGRAKKYSYIDHCLTREWLWALYQKQNRQCALSGVGIYLRSSDTNPGENTASLDRIDSSKPYTTNNVQWVHKLVNQIKWDFDQSEFLELCKAVHIEHLLVS